MTTLALNPLPPIVRPRYRRRARSKFYHEFLPGFVVGFLLVAIPAAYALLILP